MRLGIAELNQAGRPWQLVTLESDGSAASLAQIVKRLRDDGDIAMLVATAGERLALASAAALRQEGLAIAQIGPWVADSSIDGDEALGYLREGRQFDLLFTDIRMPGATDGWQLAREARQLLPDIRVIYATGLGDAANGLAEAERYVRKPYSLSELHKVLAQLGFEQDDAA